LADECLPILIAAALEESSFRSVRSLASDVKYPSTTVWRHLHSSGYVLRHLHVVPHTFSPDQKAARVESAIELKKVLMLAKYRSWRYFMTGDESWFYYSMDHERIWIPEAATAPTRPKQTISSPEQMLIIFWSPLGFAVIKILPKGARVDAPYFCSEILSLIDQSQPLATVKDQRRRIVLYFDNATPHTVGETGVYLEHHRMRRAAHRPFALDLAASGFYLFKRVKTC
jgi:hypothetical protein